MTTTKLCQKLIVNREMALFILERNYATPVTVTSIKCSEFSEKMVVIKFHGQSLFCYD